VSKLLAENFPDVQKRAAAIQHACSLLPASYMENIIPSSYIKNVRLEAIKDAFNALTEHAGVREQLCFKMRHKLTRVAWDELRHMLSYKWSYEDAAPVHLMFEGVKVPCLATRYTLDQMRRELDEEYGFTIDHDGILAHVDLHRMMSNAVLAGVRTEFFTMEGPDANGLCEVRDAQGRVPIWCFMADAARIHRGMTQTALAFSAVNASEEPCSLKQTKQFALFEKGDKWAHFVTYCKQPLKAVNELLESGMLRLRQGKSCCWYVCG
jgi:hypothetical protein